jgi:hypothetical protein
VSALRDLALDKATAAACPIQIDGVRLLMQYQQGEDAAVRKGRRGDIVVTQQNG